VKPRTTLVLLLGAGLLACACGSAAGGRVPDSAEARVAGLRASDPNQHAEDDDRRWGTPEARARKDERARRARQKAAGKPPTKGADVVKGAR
jgi:hypothetical protein